MKRGECNYLSKALNSQHSGALAVFVYYDSSSVKIENIIPSGGKYTGGVTVPVILIEKEVGETLVRIYKNNDPIRVKMDIKIVF